MAKRKYTTNKGVFIGKESETLLNLLVGANDINSYKDEVKIINVLNDSKEMVDIITDLSLFESKDGNRLWEYVINHTSFMAATVPVYLSLDEMGNVVQNKLYELICEQCEKGISIITIHPTINDQLIELSKNRLISCTSRGGGIVIRDYLNNKRTNNVYIDIIDKIADKCKEYDVILSIGSSFRSGTIIDSLDTTYYKELEEQVRIAEYLDKRGVGTIIETPGHIDPNNLLKLCKELEGLEYPIMPLGPMLTDAGLNEDDTVGVIGASLMGIFKCADILSIVTAREHLGGIPSLEDVLSAISKYKIAKHIIDLSKIGNFSEDKMISKERADKKTCNVLTRENCYRCSNVCPLRII